MNFLFGKLNNFLMCYPHIGHNEWLINTSFIVTVYIFKTCHPARSFPQSNTPSLPFHHASHFLTFFQSFYFLISESFEKVLCWRTTWTVLSVTIFISHISYLMLLLTHHKMWLTFLQNISVCDALYFICFVLLFNFNWKLSKIWSNFIWATFGDNVKNLLKSKKKFKITHLLLPSYPVSLSLYQKEFGLTWFVSVNVKIYGY